MAVFPVALPRIDSGQFAWYLSGQLSHDEQLRFASSSGAIVARGVAGFKRAKKLRDAGYQGLLWLDPTCYERRAEPPSAALLWDIWAERQSALRVAEYISPGSYVDHADVEGLASALEAEGTWAAMNGGRVSLALHHSWLTKGATTLIDQLERLNLPVALAFAARKDPLAYRGAVKGLVDLLGAVPDVALLRCDLGAVGALANGASLGAIGTSSTVRHVVPPGKKRGGGSVDSPSVFVSDLLDFRLGASLDELPVAASPRCELPCCGGRALRRFNGMHLAAEARAHNMTSIEALVEKVVGAPPQQRPELFRGLCEEAVHAAQAMSIAARRDIPIKPQVRMWAAHR